MNISKLVNIIFSYLYNSLFEKRFRDVPRQMPQHIDRFKLIRDLQPEKHFTFKVGLYQDPLGLRVVMKIWTGKRKDIHYYDLLHQLTSIQILNNVHDRVAHILPPKYKALSIPNVAFSRHEKHKLILGTKFILGKPLAKVHDSRRQIQIHNQVVGYLRFLGRHMTRLEVSQFRHKLIGEYLCILPLITIAAIFEHPNLFLDILRGIWVFVKNISAFTGYYQSTLVHGDLNFRNIYLRGKKIHILDVEQVSYTYPEFETVTSISTMGISHGLRNRLFSRISAKSKKDPNYTKRVSSLMINCEIHNLTWNAPRENVIWYTNLLKKGISLSPV